LWIRPASGNMPDDCVFCRIVADEEPAYVVDYDALTVSFLDVNSVAIGHTLVIPRAHERTLTDLNASQTGALFNSVRNVAEGIERALDPDGINAFHSSGAAAGQDVFHVHVHVIPRYENDGISFAPTRHRLTEKEGKRVSQRIGEEL